MRELLKPKTQTCVLDAETSWKSIQKYLCDNVIRVEFGVSDIAVLWGFPGEKNEFQNVIKILQTK